MDIYPRLPRIIMDSRIIYHKRPCGLCGEKLSVPLVLPPTDAGGPADCRFGGQRHPRSLPPFPPQCCVAQPQSSHRIFSPQLALSQPGNLQVLLVCVIDCTGCGVVGTFKDRVCIPKKTAPVPPHPNRLLTLVHRLYSVCCRQPFCEPRRQRHQLFVPAPPPPRSSA